MGGGSGGAFAPPRAAGRFGGRHAPNVGRDNEFYTASLVDVVLWRHYHMLQQQLVTPLSREKNATITFLIIAGSFVYSVDRSIA